MMFCPKCGSMIMPKKVDGKNVVECSCGYSEKDVKDVKVTSETKENTIKKVEVANEDDSKLPVCEHKCEECGNPESYFWEIQTRAGDEPPTRFYKCTKCKYTWREYS